MSNSANSSEKFRRLNSLTRVVIGAAIKVHKALGPGLLESAYQACLEFELGRQGFKVQRQKPIPLIYDGVTLDCAYRADMVVDDMLLLDLKAVDRFSPVHEAQIVAYLKLSGIRVGLLINFNVTLLRDGLRRFLNDF